MNLKNNKQLKNNCNQKIESVENKINTIEYGKEYYENTEENSETQTEQE